MIELFYFNLSVLLRTDNQNLANHVNEFLRLFYTVKGNTYNEKQVTKPVDSVFAGKIKNENTFVLHTNQFLHFYDYLKNLGYSLESPKITDMRTYDITSESYQVRDGWVPNEEQQPIVDFLTKDPSRSRLVGLRTGGGKTVVAMISIAKIDWKCAIVILPTYIDKWVGDVKRIHNADTKDIMVIQGSKALSAVIQLAKSKEYTGRYIVFSSRTLQEFITQYEEDPESCVDRYGCSPFELMPLLGIGTVLVDESHQHFHAIYRILIYSNVKYQIGLSATLLSDDNTVSRAHKIVYPANCVYDTGEYLRYTDVYALGYYIPDNMLRKVVTSHYGNPSYSHTAFEKSVKKHRDLYDFHLRLWCNALEDFYIDPYQPKDTCIIYVASVSVASDLVSVLRKKYPQFNIERYCEDDPFSHFEEPDIVVTTIISAGTALDKPNLRTVIQTVSVSSTVANIQNLGRLRPLTDKDTRFVYIYASNVRKQVTYHYKRLELFKNRVKTHSTRRARI